MKCDFDSNNLKTGSQKCTECSVGWLLKSSDWKCQPKCGDGKVLGVEVCDDGGLGGCLQDCSGSDPLSTCSGGDATTPTVCKKALLSS